jgi:hypothetical protein
MEIALFNRSFSNTDFSAEHRCQGIVDAAFDLRTDAIRIVEQVS